MSEQKGFTLIELAIVIMIVGILASVAMPKMTNLSGSARVTQGAENYMTVQQRLTAALGTGVATSPSNPYPTLGSISVGYAAGTGGGYSTTPDSYNMISGWNGVAGSSSDTCNQRAQAVSSAWSAIHPEMMPYLWQGGFNVPYGIGDASACFVQWRDSYSGGRNINYLANPVSPSTPGDLPFAADFSGVCLSPDGSKAPAFKADGSPTASATDLVASFGQITSDTNNCPSSLTYGH